jgi:hypothetical protein
MVSPGRTSPLELLTAVEGPNCVGVSLAGRLGLSAIPIRSKAIQSPARGTHWGKKTHKSETVRISIYRKGALCRSLVKEGAVRRNRRRGWRVRPSSNFSGKNLRPGSSFFRLINPRVFYWQSGPKFSILLQNLKNSPMLAGTLCSKSLLRPKPGSKNLPVCPSERGSKVDYWSGYVSRYD